MSNLVSGSLLGPLSIVLKSIILGIGVVPNTHVLDGQKAIWPCFKSQHMLLFGLEPLQIVVFDASMVHLIDLFN